MKNYILEKFRELAFKNGIEFTNDNSKIFEKEFLKKLDKNPLKILEETNLKEFDLLFERYLNLKDNSNQFKKENKWIEKLLEKGNVYIVGGFVRDILAGLKPKDIDLVTNLKPNEIVDILKDEDIKLDLVGEHFGVIMIKAKESFEIATFRKDVYNKSKGLGADEVNFGNLEDDWQRRDFTINALYFDLKTNIIIDSSKRGIRHCLNKEFSFIGKPEDRINEDALRVIRVYKFIKKGFKPIKGTLEAARRNFDYMMKKANPERVRTEFEKLLKI